MSVFIVLIPRVWLWVGYIALCMCFYIFALSFLSFYITISIIYVDVMSFSIWNRIIFAKSIIVIFIVYGSFYYAMGFYFKCFGWLESYIDLMGLKYYGEIIEYVGC